jgi:hypothetical protein
MYRQRNYLDVALDHYRAQLRLARRAGPQGEEDLEEFNRRLRPLERLVEELDQQVQEAQNRFAIGAPSPGADPRGRARMALGLGLARHALDDILLKSHVLLFGTDGAQLQLELLLMTGRAEEARALLDDEELKANKPILRFYTRCVGVDHSGRAVPYQLPAYDWFNVCCAAAMGDYETLAGALGETFGFLEAGVVRDRLQVSLAVTVEAAVRGQGPPWVLPVLAHDHRRDLTAMLERDTRTVADLRTLAGVLALERGRPAEAEVEFRAALDPALEVHDRANPGRPVAHAYLQRIREQTGRAAAFLPGKAGR